MSPKNTDCAVTHISLNKTVKYQKNYITDIMCTENDSNYMISKQM